MVHTLAYSIITVISSADIIIVAMAKGAKKKKPNVFRFHNSETGEHYTVRLSKNAVEQLTDKPVMKYSRKKRKHVEFKLTKKVK